MSSFKAELTALNTLLIILINMRERLINKKIFVFIDNEGVVKILNNKWVKSRMVERTHEKIKRLTRMNLEGNHNGNQNQTSITLVWIPSHQICTNEYFINNSIADTLTRIDNAKDEPNLRSCLVNKKDLKETMMIEAYTRARNRWTNVEGHRQCKAFKLDKIKGDEFIKLNRKEFSALLSFVTGHNNLRYQRSLISNGTTSSVCRFCGDGDEDSVHIMETCENFNRIRLEIFGDTKIELHERRVLDYRNILKFLKRTELIDILTSRSEDDE